MAEVVHPILGRIDPFAPGFWDAEVPFAGRAVTFDLTIEDAGLQASALDSLPGLPSDLEPLDRAARAAILLDAQSGDADAAAALYLTHHQEVLSHVDYLRLFGTARPDLDDPEPALSRLALVRVGLYPEHDDRRVLLDYSIDPAATNYLLCVSFDSNCEPVAVDLES